MAWKLARQCLLLLMLFAPPALVLFAAEPDAQPAKRTNPTTSGGTFFGNAGCAASGCHNGNGPRGTQGSEYSTWANEDPHAKAFSSLLTTDSQRMVRQFRRDAKADAATDSLCLKCHAPMAGERQPHLRGDAVGCEACHGASTNWRTKHYQAEWKRLDVAGKHDRGMAATKNLTTRIEMCARCHVGTPGMEVDHDLIAAGHPRLFFEYSAYHELLPRHWHEPKADNTFHARAWALGQVVCAKAALDLLSARAEAPQHWPELAEFNCYACHHQLTGESASPSNRALGSLPGGSWQYSMLPAVAGLGPPFAPPVPVDTAGLLEQLHAGLANPDGIAKTARQLQLAMQPWQQALHKVNGIDVDALKKVLAQQQPENWEQATQLYLALNALGRSLPESAQRRDDLLHLRDLLRFPTGKGGQKANSPGPFDLGRFKQQAARVIGMTAAHVARPIRQPNVAGAPLVTHAGPNANNASHCKTCHAAELPQYRKDGVYDLITTNASTIWENDDPHAKAWDNLDPNKNSIARRMADALGYDVSRRPECLVCHAVDLTPEQPNLANKRFDWEHNVGCEACHGMAKNWIGPHFQKEWRTQTPEYKSGLGMVDLRDPAVRAAKCASCHVGNLAERKFVTHEMYAAGHPPLLPYEPVTFAADQPAHWRLPKDVPYFQRDEVDAGRLYHAPKGEDYIARSLAAGAIVNLRESARTLAQASTEASPGTLLDFAHFDCAACHHELVVPSQRQARGYPDAPGRPIARPLPTALASAALSSIRPGLSDELNKAQHSFHAAFDRPPFGDARAISSAAQEVMAKCDRWLIELGGVTFDANKSGELLRAVHNGVSANGWDYDTAQQFAWAQRALQRYGLLVDPGNPLWRHVLPEAKLGPRRTMEPVIRQRQQLRDQFDPKKFAEDWKAASR